MRDEPRLDWGPILVEIRCGQNDGKCRRLLASITAGKYEPGLLLVQGQHDEFIDPLPPANGYVLLDYPCPRYGHQMIRGAMGVVEWGGSVPIPWTALEDTLLEARATKSKVWLWADDLTVAGILALEGVVSSEDIPTARELEGDVPAS